MISRLDMKMMSALISEKTARRAPDFTEQDIFQKCYSLNHNFKNHQFKITQRLYLALMP